MAKKKSAVSQAVRTVKKAATASTRSTRKAAKKLMPGKEGQEEIALIQTNDANALSGRFFASANALDLQTHPDGGFPHQMLGILNILC